MSRMRPKDVVAIVCSDMHLSHTPPIARSAEKSWYDVMANRLMEIRKLKEKHQCALFIAGDIFHKAEPPPELINFAITYLPKCFAIPGQHDLVNHSYTDLSKSAYYTLMHSKVLMNVGMTNEESLALPMIDENEDLFLYGYPWGAKLWNCKGNDERDLFVALVHRYCWSNADNSIPKAKNTNHASWLNKKMKGFDAIIVGDNHIPFEYKNVFNCGGLFRRRFDEINHKPRVGLLLSSGKVISHELDSSKDVFADRDVVVETDLYEMDDLLEELGGMLDLSLDFAGAVNEFIKDRKPSSGIRKLLYKALEHHEA